jgi:hypothetical protein
VRLAVSLAALALLLAPSGASAASGDMPAGAWSDSAGHWHFPGERLANNALLDEDVSFASGFWAKRQVSVCTNPRIMLADDLGDAVLGRAERDSCTMWVLTEIVRDAQARRRSRRIEGQEMVCNVTLHEDGHLGGLAHSHDGGIMDPNLPVSLEMSFDGLTGRASGEGECGARVAARYNRQHRAPNRRARIGRFHV